MTDNSKHREDYPRDINPNETSKNAPAHDIKAQEKIDIKESGLGRYQGQKPADEHIESGMSQIDKDTVRMQKENSAQQKDINQEDDRDNGDSTKDWDAENNDSGRRK